MGEPVDKLRSDGGPGGGGGRCGGRGNESRRRRSVGRDADFDGWADRSTAHGRLFCRDMRRRRLGRRWQFNDSLFGQLLRLSVAARLLQGALVLHGECFGGRDHVGTARAARAVAAPAAAASRLVPLPHIRRCNRRICWFRRRHHVALFGARTEWERRREIHHEIRRMLLPQDGLPRCCCRGYCCAGGRSGWLRRDGRSLLPQIPLPYKRAFMNRAGGWSVCAFRPAADRHVDGWGDFLVQSATASLQVGHAFSLPTLAPEYGSIRGGRLFGCLQLRR